MSNVPTQGPPIAPSAFEPSEETRCPPYSLTKLLGLFFNRLEKAIILCQLIRQQLLTERRIGPMGASTKNRPGPTGINKSQTPYGLCLELSTVSSRRVEQP